jgi:hypothetical protein
MSKENSISRRRFLKSSGALTGAACTAKQESAPFSVLSAADAADHIKSAATAGGI